MTDLEYDIIDELYFVNTFENLLKEVECDQDVLLEALGQLIQKGWVKCFVNNDREIFPEDVNLAENWDRYHYLATKKGLFAHNARD